LDIERLIWVPLFTAAAAILANRAIGVYHDGIRPLMGSLYEGKISRRETAAIDFAISLGFVLGWSIPLMILVPGMIGNHIIFLVADLIGIACPGKFKKEKEFSAPGKSLLWRITHPSIEFDRESIMGLALCGILGAGWGLGIVLFADQLLLLPSILPTQLFDALTKMSDPIIFVFSLFPILAVGYEFGVKWGLFGAILVIAARQLTIRYTTITGDGVALFLGMIYMLVLAMTRAKPSEEKQEKGIFTMHTDRIIRNIIPIAIVGALFGWGVSRIWLQESPAAMLLLGEGKVAEAFATIIAYTLSFVPIFVTTSLATGCFLPWGLGFTSAFALLTTNPIIGALIGAVTIVVEALALVPIARFFDMFPGMRRMAENIKNAISTAIEWAVLLGGTLAANTAFPGGFGLILYAFILLLNEIAGYPIAKMGVGAVAAIITIITGYALMLVGFL